jgi:VWFA-related protein
LACCASFLAAPAAAFGQETVPFDSDLVIRSNTSLVQVRVVAEDSKGKPVTDLQRADFRIEDDRKPQPITLFSADRGTRPASSAASNPSADPSAASADAPAGYSPLNTKYTDRLFAQEQVLKLLKNFQPRLRSICWIASLDCFTISLRTWTCCGRRWKTRALDFRTRKRTLPAGSTRDIAAEGAPGIQKSRYSSGKTGFSTRSTH